MNEERSWSMESMDIEKDYWVVEVTEAGKTFIAHDWESEARFAEQKYAQYFGEEVVEYYESKGKDVSIRVVYVSGGSNE